MGNHNTEKDFYEIKAQITLKKMFSTEYSRLIRSESPDLITNDLEIGVEVTRAVNPQDEKERKYFERELINSDVSNVNPEKLEAFHRNGKQILKLPDSEKIIGYSDGFWHSNINIIGAVTKKIKAINCGKYRSVKYMDVYVFSQAEFTYDDCDLDEIMKSIIELQSKYDNTFRYLFVDAINILILFDLQKNIIQKFSIEDLLDEICIEAKNLAENEFEL